jgi:hypothetical protein
MTWPEEELVSAVKSSERTEEGTLNSRQSCGVDSCKLAKLLFLDSESLSTFNTPGMCFMTSKKR